MNDNELKKLWQQQPLRKPDVSAEQVVSAMQNKMTGFRRVLFTRDIGELVACALVIIVFAFFYYREQSPISRLGELIVIGSTIFIAFRLIYAHRSNPTVPPGATIVESLRAELNAVRAQSRLLGSILWWYILPGDIGLVVGTWGNLQTTDSAALPTMVAADIILTLFFVAVAAYVYWLNKRARSKQLLPLEAQLESLLHSAETGEPLDETHRTNLRPIILSMTAAGQVKPAEFKLDFWQLAIYGVSGIVGIWFFWMLDRAMESERKARVHMPETAAQSFHFDATNRSRFHFDVTNRYSIVAQKVVDLFNAGDYAAIQKIYDANMSKVFPPKETSDFYTRLATGFGNIENIEGPTGKGFRGWTAFRLHCQHGEMIMSLALDTDDNISGIHFRPVLPPRPSAIGSVVRRMLSWQYLAWLPPFLLGALLYTWLIQTWVGRAVGISILGVHLCKGLNLILWDEIKEVRPLRILSFRNLWLIKESGEKTLMHWTPLERHSELKAAVERCAPPDHPIRKYLPLLKRI
jgi:hypothetical protein